MKQNRLGYNLFIGVVIVVVVVTAAAGLWIAGSPVEERARRMDMARVSDLQNIANGIDQYYNLNNALPTELQALLKTRDVYVSSVADPETGITYGYVKRSDKNYDVCADFTRSTMDGETRQEPYERFDSQFWRHDAGTHCYNITVRVYPK